MKKIAAALLAVLLALSVLPGMKASAGSDFAPVTLDGAALGAKAFVDGGEVFLPVRSICEALGDEAVWSDADGVRKITVTNGGEDVVLDLTNQRINDNGHDFYAQSGSAIRLVSDTAYLDSDLFDAVFSLATDYDAGKNAVTVRRVCENAITIATEKIEAEEEYLKTTIQYPQISSMADAAVQDAINAVFKQAALASEAEGQKNAADMKQEAEAFPRGSKCETYFNYLVKYNRNGLLSVVLDDYQFAGGAHGSTVRSSYTFDLASGKALSLEDLMLPGSGYADVINAAIRKEIDEKEAAGELGELTGVRFSDIGPDPDYFLSGDGIVFYFQQYAYFPYAAGIQEFTVPYAELKEMLKPETGPLRLLRL